MQPEIKKIKGTKTLLQGAPGSGKSTSLITALQHPAIDKLVVLGTEPGFEESLLDAAVRLDVDLSKLHFKYVQPTVEGFDSLRAVAQRMNTMSYGDLGSMKQGINKHEYQQFFRVLDAMSNFVCDRTGEELGAVDDFPENWFFAFDSLTGLNDIIKQLHLGGKPAPHEGEWNVIMEFERTFINTMISNLKCFMVLTAHVVKAPNLLTGIPMITIDALGSKLGPKLPAMFSDQPMAYKDGANFYWSTSASNADLKNRALPISDKLKPSFVQIVEVWDKRRKAAGEVD